MGVCDNFSLLPPVIAIGLALVTKEVYTSLLAGILAGGLLYSNFNLEKMINAIEETQKRGVNRAEHRLHLAANCRITPHCRCLKNWSSENP